tara:strand:- start:2187 stop:2453 length:267 start_codon:yes stop_codon:yes gene_type:complete
MTIVINKNIPLEERGHWGNPMSPIRKEMEEVIVQLEIGDSFILPDQLVAQINGYHSAKANVRSAFKKHGMNCTSRNVGSGLVRVWRTH